MRLVYCLLIAWAAVMVWAVSLMLDNSRIIEMTRVEVQAIRQQQDANAKDIRYLIDQHWDLQERIKQVRMEAWR